MASSQQKTQQVALEALDAMAKREGMEAPPAPNDQNVSFFFLQLTGGESALLGP